MNKKIILASKSPRRIQLLTEAGFDPIIIPADIEERVNPSLSPSDMVKTLSLSKASAVKKNLTSMVEDLNSDYVNQTEVMLNSTKVLSENLPIIGADTIVFYHEIIGKPKDKDDALSILMTLSGKKHLVYTGVTILSLLDEKVVSFTEETEVFFKQYTKVELEEYLNTDEPYDKAGAYAIQGYFSRFIDHIEGDYDNVVGLPIAHLLEELKTF